jgi:NADH-quinone oxidoreductase subunit K
MAVSLTSYLGVSAVLFRIGLRGLVLNRRSVLLVLMCVEMLLLSVNLLLMAFSVYLDDMMGIVFSLYVLTVAAAESAIGLAILVVYFRVRGTIAMDSMALRQG